ncbi:hypothetical protein [Bartonella heixiaziensis]|uniref:hypothetical protein n=1 Tax=Bartonella heixiaziensis TaxID=1461000 RepID=UPI003D1D37EA
MRNFICSAEVCNYEDFSDDKGTYICPCILHNAKEANKSGAGKARVEIIPL